MRTSIQGRSLVSQGCISSGVSRAKVTSNGNASRSLDTGGLPKPPRTINSLKHFAFQTSPGTDRLAPANQAAIRLTTPTPWSHSSSESTVCFLLDPYHPPLTPFRCPPRYTPSQSLARRSPSMTQNTRHRPRRPNSYHPPGENVSVLAPSVMPRPAGAGRLRFLTHAPSPTRCFARLFGQACMHEGGGMRWDSFHTLRQLT